MNESIDADHPKLSILICHLEGRALQLAELGKCLLDQLDKIGHAEFADPTGMGAAHIICNGVEIITESDNGELSIGAKRNLLLDRAGGDYICFIDDDDMVPDYYVAEILAAITPDKTGNTPDAVGIFGHYYHDGRGPDRFVHSIQYSEWFTDTDGVLCRTPNHINPVKRSLALKARFPEINHGEDFEYSQRILKLLDTDPEFAKTEVFIDKVMYEYRK
jgi:glycosyltransferase involved in cell wall biosynthesis